MARQIKNILVGVGTLQVSGENDVNGVAQTGAGVYVDGTSSTYFGALADMGFTMNGVEVTLEPNIVDIVVDQLGDAAKLIEQSIKVMVKTTLAESTLANLAIAWGRSDLAYKVNGLGGQLKIGVNATGKPVERHIKFIGKSPEGFDRTYLCTRAVSVASSAHGYKRGEATVFPVEFRVLPDATATGAEYGTITDSPS